MAQKIAVIGAGFTGLAAAFRLAELGFDVTVYEKDPLPGGLAVGFKDKKWAWSLEKHYHHLFVSDTHIINLAKKIGHSITFTQPVTSTLVNGEIYQLDSVVSLLKFRPLPVFDRIRTGFGLAFLRFNPWWKMFESFTAKKYILMVMGQKSWDIIWEPLFVGKFGEHADKISASWFWSRISKRSAALGYPEKGFLGLAKAIEQACKKRGVKFVYTASVEKISSTKDGVMLVVNGQQKNFAKVICTLPTGLFAKLANLTYPNLPGLGAVNLVLALHKSFLDKGFYWLNINDRKMPFLALVEHTNYQKRSKYGGDTILYIGNYLPASHKYFSWSENELVAEFLPHLQKINPGFKKAWIRKAWVHKAPFAQPIVTPGYGAKIPKFATSLKNVYLANIQQVYPHDRGTNYAVELGEKVADYANKN